MDNLTNNIILIERVEQVPRNDIEMYRMDWVKIRSMLTNPGPETFIHKNEEMIKFVSTKPSFSWLISFYEKQSIIPKDAITYWLINHNENKIY